MSRGLGDVYKRQINFTSNVTSIPEPSFIYSNQFSQKSSRYEFVRIFFTLISDDPSLVAYNVLSVTLNVNPPTTPNVATE